MREESCFIKTLLERINQLNEIVSEKIDLINLCVLLKELDCMTVRNWILIETALLKR